MMYESGVTNEANMVVGDDPLEEIRQLKAAFQKQTTRMESLEHQVERLTEEVKHLKGIPDEDPGDMSDVDPDKDPRDVLAVTKHRLDNGDSCPLEASIWDAVLFIGHPAVGAVVSLVTVFMWAVNIACQVWFCYLVWINMLEADVTAETLDLLLRFRIFAHSVDFADSISQRSMIYLYCSEEVPGKLHESAAQATLYNLIAKFKPAEALGGRSLMCLAQLIWLTFILKEMNVTLDFARSLSHIGVGKRTRVIMTETDTMLASGGASSRQLAGDSNQPNQRPELARTPTGSIAKDVPHMIVCRLCSITWTRYWLSMAFIVVPRLAVASMMGIVGVYFLGKTADMEDLVLNAIALNFVLDIDNILYSVFAPKRLKTLMNNVEPFPMPHKHRRNTAGLHTILKMSLVAGLMGLVYWFIDWPFLWRMSMADEILCGGNTDFVWAVNSASGMVHVARSKNESGAAWTVEEEVILQVIAPNLTHTSYYEEPYWQDYSNFDQSTINIATSSSGRAIWESDDDADSYDEAEYETLQFKKLVDLQVLTTGDAAKELSCADLSSGQVYDDGTISADAALAYLKAALDNDTVTSCSDVPWQECSKLENNQLRALCPVHCGCDKPARYYLGFAGLFHSPTGGCPSQCEILASARNELLYSLSHFDESSDNWQRFEECDVINGTGLSASYPCYCGNTTCASNFICTESTSSCYQAPTTTLQSGEQSGSTTLRVSSTEGFHEGGRVVITGGGNSETGTIASFGSIILVDPLEHSYPANSTVVEEWAPENASEAPSPTPAPTRQELSGSTQSTAEDGGPPTHPPTAESTPAPPGSTPAPTGNGPPPTHPPTAESTPAPPGSTPAPTESPTNPPTAEPTPAPTESTQPPTAEPTPAPTESSSPESTPAPTNGGPTPTAAPTAQPTPAPTGSSQRRRRSETPAPTESSEEPTPGPTGSGGPPQNGPPPSTTPEDRRLEGRQLSAAISEQAAVGGMYGCFDVPAHRLIFDAGDGCVDLDEVTLSTNSKSKSCHTATCSRDYDDSDFTAAFMCCHCSSDGVQGGVTEHLSTSYGCLDDLTDNCQNMHLPSFWYLLFVRGLNEYIASSTEHKHLVRNILYGSGVELIPQLSDTQKDELISWVTDGNFQYSLMDGEWRIMPDIPHPRGLKGCEYLASFEVKSLLGIDICNDEPFSSLRLLCPETCGCRAQVYDVEHGERQTYTYTDLEPFLFTYSQKRTDLRHCPASCILAHPTVSGSDTYTGYQAGSGVGPK